MRTKQAGLVLLFLLCSIFYTNAGFAQEVPVGFELVAQNEYLSLYLNKSTTEFAVQHNDSGELWLSNPINSRVDKDTIFIEYYNPSDELLRMNNYDDSIKLNQFQIEEIENGVRISYLLGREWWDDDYLPLMVPQDRFENEILPYIPERDQRWFLSMYELIQLEKVDPDYTRVKITNLPTKEEIFGDYTVVSPGRTLSASQKSTLTMLLVDTVVAARSDIPSRADLKFSEIEHLVERPAYVIKNTIRPWDRTDIIELMKTIGYTPDKIAEDHKACNIEPPVLNVEVFRITLEYMLDGNSFVVRVPMDKVEYPKDVVPNKRYLTGVSGNFRPTNRSEVFDHFGQIGGTLVTFPLYSINLLRHFAAAEQNAEGYIFVPDGSGALIPLGEGTNLQYSRNVYGTDHTIAHGLEQSAYVMPMDRVLSDPLYMPVFGIKENNKAMFAIIEDGHGMSRIRANTAGGNNLYNRVSSEFILMPYGDIILQETDRAERAKGRIKAFPDKLPDEDIVIRFAFFVGDDADYSGMARYYQQYLEMKYGMTLMDNEETDIPLIVELIGAIPKAASIMGIPRTIMEPLTTYEQAAEIVERLLAANISNIKLRYTGWTNGGLEPGYPNKVKIANALGGTKGFKELTEYLAENDVDFYPGMSFLMIYPNKYGRFKLNRDVAHSLANEPVIVYKDYFSGGYFSSLHQLDGLITKFANDYIKYEIAGLALDDLGKILASDYNKRREHIPRADAQRIIENQLAKLQNQYQLELLIDSPNIYAIPYATHVVNVPLTSNQTVIFRESVPFYQMVLHGYVNYSGVPLNTCPDFRRAFLKSIETGAIPYFSWMYSDGIAIKETWFDHLFPNYYETWFDEAVRAYQEANQVLRQVQGQRIIKHEQISPDLYITSYENEVSIIVNYNKEAVEYQGRVVQGEGYLVIKGGEINEAK